MCKNPKTINTRSKYLSYSNGMQFQQQIECGICSECIRNKQEEYILRTIYEAKKCIENGGYMYFDTLTYKTETMPRLSKFIDNANYNRGCFKYEDVREFYENLRAIYKKQKDLIRYFITAEYGELKGRPHYHILLFIATKELNILELSENVYKAWNKGRTDGIRFKGKNYVLKHNLIEKVNLDAFRYIAKYVSKSITFNEILNDKWTKLEKYYKMKNIDEIKIKRYRKAFFRHLQPFHRQSQHYGECAIDYIGKEWINTNNKMYYKTDTQEIKRYIQIRPYFKRKLYQEQIQHNGKRIWQYTEEGRKQKEKNEENNIRMIADKLEAMNANKKVTTTQKIKDIAKYIYLERGRATQPNYEPSYKSATQFNYNSDRDRIYLGKILVSNTYIGNDIQGYCTTNAEPTEIEETKLIYKCEYEKIIQALTDEPNKDNETIKLKEKLLQIRKTIFQH